MAKSKKSYRVTIVNVQTVGAMSGYGQGKTLEEAQRDALNQARRTDPNAKLDSHGYTVYMAGGVNC